MEGAEEASVVTVPTLCGKKIEQVVCVAHSSRDRSKHNSEPKCKSAGKVVRHTQGWPDHTHTHTHTHTYTHTHICIWVCQPQVKARRGRASSSLAKPRRGSMSLLSKLGYDVYIIYTVFLAGKPPNIWSYTVLIYSSSQP